jgi:hypothetical protein
MVGPSLSYYPVKAFADGEFLQILEGGCCFALHLDEVTMNTSTITIRISEKYKSAGATN